jgi:hypothetical protein
MALSDHIVCVSPISKNMDGGLDLVESEPEKCEKLECETLEAVHRFKFEIGGHDCDGEIGRLLDGALYGTMSHKFTKGDGTLRGVHEGIWRLRTGALVASGRLSGVTNAGTHREPVFDACQKCEDPGVMEGMMIGKVLRGTSRLVGCEIRCAYRIRYEADEKGGSGDARGTLEGGLVCFCPE